MSQARRLTYEKSMKVLVTGAAGFVGREIVRQLHAAGHAARVLSRDTLSSQVRELVPAFTTDVRSGDVLNATSLANVCNGMEAVIHLVGIISEVRDQTYENVHTRGTQNIVAAARKAGVKRFVHMSALGTRLNAVARYHQSKWAAEEMVRNSGLEWTIFRPSIIYGAGDGFVNLFANIARRSPVVPLIGGGKSKFQPVPVEAVAQCFVKSLTEPKSIGQTYDLCGNEVLTLEEIVSTILSVMGRKRHKLSLPFGLARIQATLLEFVYSRLLGKPPPLNRDQLLMLQEDNVGNGQSAEELFALKIGPFAKGIAAYLKSDA
jgi:uncharacterized protein YbjT (DUF2867 family)